MKGMVFTEFIDMVEQRFSPDLMDEVIDAAAPPNDGAYTAVGHYDHRELVTMVVELSARTGIAVPNLLRTFGEYLFGRFLQGYPQLFMTCPVSSDHESLEKKGFVVVA